jgi:flagellar motor switch protein FliN/FliY
MPELNAEQLTAFAATLNSLRDSFSLAISENLNQAVALEEPVITQLPLDELMTGSQPMLQTTFAIPALCAEEGLLAFPSADAPTLVDLIMGGAGVPVPTPLLDEQMNALANAMSGIVQGFANAVGNMLGQPLQTASEATALEPLILPPSFALARMAIRVDFTYQIAGVMDGQISLYVTPDFALALIPPADSSADTGASGASAAAMNGGAEPAAVSTPFQPFDTATPADALPRGMDLLLDIPLEATVELGRARMLIRDVLELSPGSIVELERVAGEPVDLLVNGRLVAKGEVVVIDDNFGIRITEIVSPADRVASLGKRL